MGGKDAERKKELDGIAIAPPIECDNKSCIALASPFGIGEPNISRYMLILSVKGIGEADREC
uniref:Uncharacterized protein n=1 Tax=Nelumbo nucifera TaxID=4432 RepID=A0A822XYN5_NELNU|nr:TPA_asm: hypothetical protein HUJ06_026954 [Nelumbo nucifera]DAD25571.1 TPA_asm: hypothetical protein HUJ06_027035 [Nelumbo nucifera]